MQSAPQFIDFIDSTKKIDLKIASEYLLMATWLTYLKSKLLLPDDEEEDPSEFMMLSYRHRFFIY